MSFEGNGKTQTRIFMKNFKLVATLLVVAVCTMFVTSCSNDDDDKGGSQGGKKLSKAVWDYEDSSYDNTTWTFQYASGKLSKVTLRDRHGDEPVTITYSGKNVSIDNGFQTLQLNNAGFVESGVMDFGSPYRFTCEYSNGYLTKVNYPDSEYKTRIEIKYDNNGNISSAYEYSNNQIVTEFKFTPSNYPAKGKNIFLLGQLFNSDYTLDLFWPAYYAGLLGKDSPNLVSKVECLKDDEYGDLPDDIRFNYTFDNSGYVEKMTVKDDWDTRRISFTYE